tara:strand:- start:255 stop:731 length:477 start_codon:yes stop_codon:yes gene_type:complete
MAITTAAGISSTTVTTDQQAPLGFELVVPNGDQGEQVWVYIQAAAALAVGDIVSRAAGAGSLTLAAAAIAPVDTPTILVVGVAQHVIATNSYGFIMKKGIGEVLADTGGVTANNGLKVGNVVPGRADNIAGGDHAFAVTSETVTATNLATCWINCPGA